MHITSAEDIRIHAVSPESMVGPPPEVPSWAHPVDTQNPYKTTSVSIKILYCVDRITRSP
ncbi:MAG: hypothetical protein ACE1ZW_06530 [Nitrospirales bacterium]